MNPEHRVKGPSVLVVMEDEMRSGRPLNANETPCFVRKRRFLVEYVRLGQKVRAAAQVLQSHVNHREMDLARQKDAVMVGGEARGYDFTYYPGRDSQYQDLQDALNRARLAQDRMLDEFLGEWIL